jgi:hypothetical protein
LYIAWAFQLILGQQIPWLFRTLTWRNLICESPSDLMSASFLHRFPALIFSTPWAFCESLPNNARGRRAEPSPHDIAEWPDFHGQVLLILTWSKRPTAPGPFLHQFPKDLVSLVCATSVHWIWLFAWALKLALLIISSVSIQRASWIPLFFARNFAFCITY